MEVVEWRVFLKGFVKAFFKGLVIVLKCYITPHH
jgi:hypothetical protein